MENYEEIIKNIKILLADDDEDYMMMTYAFLTQKGYNVDKATNGKDAIKMLETNNYQIALLDYYMPDFTGEEVIEKIRKNNKEIIIILQTGFSGQKPPVDTMKKLGIQNYYDKTEGIDKLNLELISAVKMFAQQNEIELAKFNANTIGNLIFGVAQQIKETLLSISAGMELTNMLISNFTSTDEKQKAIEINKYYEKNKEYLEKIDKVLSSIINQSTSNTEYILSDTDVVELLNIILKNMSKVNNVNIGIKSALKSGGYIKGSINDAIFIVSAIVDSLIKLQNENLSIDIVFTDDEEKWYFKITSENVSKFSHSQLYLLKKVVQSMNETDIYIEDSNVIILSINK